jgi:GPH family glycoside/pentoside/hexuronide:cation symporter
MIFLASYFVSAFLSMPLWVWSVRRFGKKPIWVASYVAVTLALVALFFWVGEGDTLPMVIVLILTGATFSARALIAPAMQADVIDYDELYTGKRREAQYGGLWSIVTKFTVIPSMSIPLAVLAQLGYTPNVEQSETVELAIRAIFALAPAVSGLVALPLVLLYPISEDRHARIVEGIEKHRRGESAVDPLTGAVLEPPSARGEDEDTGWFLDHFSPRELQIAAGGRSLVGRIQAWCLASLAIMGLAVAATFYEISDLEHEPGVVAVFAILFVGLSFASFVFSVMRLTAARELSAGRASREEVALHWKRAREEKPGARARSR